MSNSTFCDNLDLSKIENITIVFENRCELIGDVGVSLQVLSFVLLVVLQFGMAANVDLDKFIAIFTNKENYKSLIIGFICQTM